MVSYVILTPEEKLMRVVFSKRIEDDFDLYQEVNGVSLYTALMEALDNIRYLRNGPSFKGRYKRVILLRFGFEDGRSRTLEQVGQEFMVTRERVRQIEAKTLRLLRHPSRARALEAFIKANVF